MSDKLFSLRKLLKQHNVDFYYQASTDEHHNEYVPHYWQRLAFISEFTGSNGEVIIGSDTAHLWTDGRYELQSKMQLDADHWQSSIYGEGTLDVPAWLEARAKNAICGVNPKLISITKADVLQKALEKNAGKLKALDEDLIDSVWQDRPAISKNKLFVLPEKLSGMSCINKISQVRKIMQQEHADTMFVCALDDIAWLLNIRGTDVAHTPLVLSYLLLSLDKVVLFIDKDKISQQDLDYFVDNEIKIEAYSAITKHLNALQGRVLLDPDTTSWWVQTQINSNQIQLLASPIKNIKMIKNSCEQKNVQLAHKKDAIAVIRFLCWLDKNWHTQDEISAANKLDAIRLQDKQVMAQDLSFPTISGFAENGAIIHYSATPKTNKKFTDKALYLVDSGGQYLYGTTDITRTVHFGEPTREEKYYYTLVLKGHLALGNAIFPKGTTGVQLDTLARAPLWQQHANYNHGTGHGVGCFLGVHEGPVSISPRSKVALKVGMVLSNEPGVYFQGKFGIRIENLCLVVPHAAESNNNFGEFYTFEDLTLVPYCKKLLLTELLSSDEVAQINQYHENISSQIQDSLSQEEVSWLVEATSAIFSV